MLLEEITCVSVIVSWLATASDSAEALDEVLKMAAATFCLSGVFKAAISGADLESFHVHCESTLSLVGGSLTIGTSLFFLVLSFLGGQTVSASLTGAAVVRFFCFFTRFVTARSYGSIGTCLQKGRLCSL